ncbi:hypothetical protein [Stenotrophomonas maltophilia]|nr:hypothetical protein [Stenotrophomonas maltophilia]
MGVGLDFGVDAAEVGKRGLNAPPSGGGFLDVAAIEEFEDDASG